MLGTFYDRVFKIMIDDADLSKYLKPPEQHFEAWEYTANYCLEDQHLTVTKNAESMGNVLKS